MTGTRWQGSKLESVNSPVPDSLVSAVSVLDSLVRAGVRHFVVSPGSRNAPLTYALGALDAAGVVTAHVRIDERSAGFTALGLAKASGIPAVVITTSGTAVGNLVPAVMEAAHSGVPLIVLSADRPPRLRGTGANQTTSQPGIFANFVRAEADLVDYQEGDPQATRALAGCLDAAFGRNPQDWTARGERPLGPVHINLALDTPLTPEPQAAELLAGWAESLTEAAEEAVLAPVDSSARPWLLSGKLPAQSAKTIVVAGDGAGALAQQFAQNLGLPLLAEPSSNARFSPSAITCYTDVLRSQLGAEVEKVVVFGHPTLSRPVHEIINSSETQTFFYEPSPAPWHQENRLPGIPVKRLATLGELAGQGFGLTLASGDTWLEAWQKAGKSAASQALAEIEHYRATGKYKGRTAGRALALDIWQEALQSGETLVVGSSNLIRDLDYIAPSLPACPRVFANRGLAGIDGTIATAAGISLANPQEPASVRLICGDLTFLHDAGSLSIGPLEQEPRLRIDVLDDRGGGIFATLEHGQLGKTTEFEETVRRFFTTPHQVELEELAAAYRSRGMRVRIHRV